jgi:hypothetical protein
MGKVRRRLSHRGLWLHARVIPAPFPSGKTGHISGAMDVNLEWTRISDDRRPQAWKRGSPEPERGNQPEEPDHARKPTPEWAMPWDSWQGEPGVVKDLPPLRECGRGTDGGTVVEGPARGSWDHRN